MLEKWMKLEFSYPQFLTPCVSVHPPFFITFQHLESNPSVIQICWRSCSSYSDIEIKFCQLFRHPQNWRYSSASQHEIPVLLTNLIVHFQTFETFISRLTSVFVFAIIFDALSKNKLHKTHLRCYSAYNSRYDITEFFTLERAKCLEFFALKLRVRSLAAAGNFTDRQADRQTDRQTDIQTEIPVAEFCK